MRVRNYIQSIAILLALIIIFIPIVHAEDLDLVYDSVGNLISGDGYYRTYDSFNHLVQIRLNTSTGNITQEMTWHPTEERIFVKKEYYTNGSLKAKIKYLTKNTIKITNSSGTFFETYVYQDGFLVGQIDANGNKYSVHDDHLGSASLLVDSSGNVVENSFYEPFGSIISGGQNSRYDFTGKEFDSITQEYDYNARMYSPYRTKFNQCDTVKYNMFNPQGFNCYAYALNNPYKYKDDSGHVPIPVVTGSIGGIVGFFIGAGYSAYSQYSDTGTVDIQKVGQASLVGASTGFVAGATFGLATPAIAAAESQGGIGAAAPLAMTAGGVSNAVGGQTAIAVDNALSGSDISSGLGNTQDISGDFLLGVGTTGITYGAQSSALSISTNKGTLERSAHAAVRMQERGITASDIQGTVNNNKGFLGNYKGDYRYNYYDQKSKLLVPTKDNRIKTVFKETQSRVKNMMASISKTFKSSSSSKKK